MIFITRKFIQEHPTILFVFGDNDLRKGFGGMAREFRDEPNSIGIRTKKYPGLQDGDFYTDDDLVANKKKIDEDIQLISHSMGNFRAIFIPVGIGEGFARLEENAPQTYRYLKEQLALGTGYQNSDEDFDYWGDLPG